MSAINDGGPAFPFRHAVEDRVHYSPGMSLRDWYAGMAMQGMQGNPEYDRNTSSQLAQQSYVMADAMLKARSWVPPGSMASSRSSECGCGGYRRSK